MASIGLVGDAFKLGTNAFPSGAIPKFTDVASQFNDMKNAADLPAMLKNVEDLKDVIKNTNEFKGKTVTDLDLYTALKNSKMVNTESGQKYLRIAIELSRNNLKVTPDVLNSAAPAANSKFIDNVLDKFSKFDTDLKTIDDISKLDSAKKLEYIKQVEDFKKIDTENARLYDGMIQLLKQDELTNLQKFTKAVMDNLGTSFVVLGGTVTGLTFLGLALDRYLKSKDNPRTITKVENYGGLLDPTSVKITYEPNIKILRQDSITIRGSKTTPSIDGSPSIIESPNDSSVVVQVTAGLRTFTAGGTIDVTPDFTASLGKEIGKPVGAIAQEAGSVAGEGLKGIGGGISEFFSGLFGSGSGTTSMLVLAVIVILMVMK